MYTPPPFKPDRAASLRFADARGFGTVCAWNGARPIAASLPFYLSSADDGTPQAWFHLARGNPLLKLADGATPWLLAINGADAYVSADFYVSADQVPTWLYQAVHLTGPVRRLSDDELGVQVDALSAKFENRLLPKKPWTSDKMTPGRLDAMKKAIVGLEMAVEEVEGSFKLNQHKSEADYAAVATALAAQTDTGAQQIAHLMRDARPEAFSNEEAFADQMTDETNGLERSAPCPSLTPGNAGPPLPRRSPPYSSMALPAPRASAFASVSLCRTTWWKRASLTRSARMRAPSGR